MNFHLIYLFIFLITQNVFIHAMIKEEDQHLCISDKKSLAKNCSLRSLLDHIEGNTSIITGYKEGIPQGTHVPEELKEIIYSHVQDHLKKQFYRAVKRIHPSDYENFLKNIPERFREELKREVIFFPLRWYSYSWQEKKITTIEENSYYKKPKFFSKDGSTLYTLIDDYTVAALDTNTFNIKEILFHYERRKKEKMVEQNSLEYYISEVQSENPRHGGLNHGLICIKQIIHDSKRNMLYLFIPSFISYLIHFDLKKKEFCNVTEINDNNDIHFAINSDADALYIIQDTGSKIMDLATGKIESLINSDGIDSVGGHSYRFSWHHRAKLCPIAISPDGSHLATEYNYGRDIYPYLLKRGSKLIKPIRMREIPSADVNHSLAFTPTGHLLYWAHTNVLAIHKLRKDPDCWYSKEKKTGCVLPINLDNSRIDSFYIRTKKDPLQLPSVPASKQKIFFMNKKDIPSLKDCYFNNINVTSDLNKIQLFMDHNSVLELTAGFTLDQAHYLAYLQKIIKNRLKMDNIFLKRHYFLTSKSNPVALKNDPILKTFKSEHADLIKSYIYKNTIGSCFIAPMLFDFLRNHQNALPKVKKSGWKIWQR
jgi:hypothetical protein